MPGHSDSTAWKAIVEAASRKQDDLLQKQRTARLARDISAAPAPPAKAPRKRRAAAKA